VPAGVLRVGLFLDQERDDIEWVLSSVPLDVLQFHGREREQYCSAFGVPWLKALSMADDGALRRAERDHPGAMGWLLDSHRAGQRQAHMAGRWFARG
jgi:phosphoribosylanthranilate isomerase